MSHVLPYIQKLTYLVLNTRAIDNHGHSYEVRLLRSDYEKIPSLVLRILDTPGSWYLKTILGRDGFGPPIRDKISIDFGQNWDCINMDQVMAEVKSLFGTKINPDTFEPISNVEVSK